LVPTKRTKSVARHISFPYLKVYSDAFATRLPPRTNWGSPDLVAGPGGHFLVERIRKEGMEGEEVCRRGGEGIGPKRWVGSALPEMWLPSPVIVGWLCAWCWKRDHNVKTKAKYMTALARLHDKND